MSCLKKAKSTQAIKGYNKWLQQ